MGTVQADIINLTFNNSFINCASHNQIITAAILSALVTISITFIIYQCVYKKDQWIKSYFEYNKRYTEIRSKLPIEMLSHDHNCLENCKQKNKFINLLWQYFELCYEQYYLVEEKGWLEDKLWQEWKQGIEYNMGLPAYQYAWKKYLEVLKINPNVNGKEARLKSNYYSKFVCFMNELR